MSILRASLACLAIAACASQSPDHAYASAVSQAICTQLQPCCTANGFSFDDGQCELGGAGYIQAGNDAAKNAGAIFDQQAADDCVAAIRTLASTCRSGGDDPMLSEPCRRVWVGTKAAGSPCSSDVECAPGTGRGACVANACAVLAINGAVGDPCATTDCGASGLQCDALGSKTCIALTPMGGSCGALTTCVKGAFCGGSGTCVAVLAQGAACTANDQCASNGCIANACAANDLATSKPCTGM